MQPHQLPAADTEPRLHAELRRFAIQVQTGFVGVIALSLVMLVLHG